MCFWLEHFDSVVISVSIFCSTPTCTDDNTWLLQFRQAKTEIVSASKVAYRFLLGVTNNVKNGPESPNNSNRGEGSPRFQAAWLKNMITNGAKPSTSSEAENQNGVMPVPPTHDDDRALLHSSSSHDS